MDTDTFVSDLRADNETALSRLGSSKSLYALTGGEMAGEAVRRVAASEAVAAAEQFEAWSADEVSVADKREATKRSDAAALFGAVAEDARHHRDAVAPVSFDAANARSFPEYEVLAGKESTASRTGGLLARCLLADARAGQMVGFFVGNADPRAANEFRDLRSDVTDRLDETADLLDSVCETDEEWVAAREAATGVLEAAYEDYVATLEGMGVKPKNVC